MTRLCFALPALLAPVLLISPSLAQAQGLTPAEQRIARARVALEASPEDARMHNDLAFGLARRARETANPDYYAQAEAALARSLELAPGNLEALKLQTWLLLGNHDWQAALDKAQTLQQRVPDDVLVYGFLVDAHVELGNYQEAERACQWMLDLRPGNVPGLTRASYLRELFGETQGAINLLRSAFHATRSNEREDLAWIQTHIGHLERTRGNLVEAEKALAEALVLFPDYHYALAQLALVQLDKGDADAAVRSYAQRLELAPHPENVFDLADATLCAGKSEEAAVLFERFEKEARGEMGGLDNANRELIRFYSGEAYAGFRSEGGPEEALRLARFELSHRGDLYTHAVHGEALLAAGQPVEALVELEQALAVGVRDPRIAYLAGRAALAAEKVEEARGHLESSLRFHPYSRQARSARELLSGLPVKPADSALESRAFR